MRVILNGQTYLIGFRHIDKKRNRATACTIRKVDAADELTTLGEGKAKCNREDRFVKETGRVLSLTRALAQTTFDRPMRQVVWAAYHNRRKHNGGNNSSACGKLDQAA